jgi:reverse gyrase
MKIGDIVELIDENDFEGMYRGRMTVIGVYDNIVRCAHLDYEWADFEFDDLVVMEEFDD